LDAAVCGGSLPAARKKLLRRWNSPPGLHNRAINIKNDAIG